jgi:hypothetical protein
MKWNGTTTLTRAYGKEVFNDMKQNARNKKKMHTSLECSTVLHMEEYRLAADDELIDHNNNNNNNFCRVV